MRAHKISGYSIVNVSLTKLGTAPGDATSEQMRILADLADQYSYSELRTTKRQTIVFLMSAKIRSLIYGSHLKNMD